MLRKICATCKKPNIGDIDNCSACGNSLKEVDTVTVSTECVFCGLYERLHLK